MWKAAFSGRSEAGGSSTSRPAEPRRKRSHRAESVTSSVSRRPQEDEKDRERDRRRSGRSGSVYGDDSVYAPPSSSRAGPQASSSSSAAPLTASALRMLPDDEEEWEDEDKEARSERKSRRGDSEDKRRKSSSGRAGWVRSRSRSRDRKDKDKDKKKATSSSQKTSREKDKDRSKRQELVSAEAEEMRAMPEMGSFEQFPGQYASGHMGPAQPAHSNVLMSGALPSSAPQQSQFPGQDNAPFEPSMPSRADSYGHAADYYLDTGESVQQQPGVRPVTPNMLVNPDLHLAPALAEAQPVSDTGNGAAADFYSGNVSIGTGVSASAPVTPAGKTKTTKPGKQSSWSASKPSKTSKPLKTSKPSKTSSSGAAAVTLAGAAGVAALSAHSSSGSYQQASSNGYSKDPVTPHSKPSRHDSQEGVYYGPPPQSSASNSYGASNPPTYTYGVPGSASAYISAQSTNNSYATAHTSHGKQPVNSNIPLYAAGAAAAGLAAYGVNHQHHQHNGQNMTSNGGHGGGGRPPTGGNGYYPSSASGSGNGINQMHHHEHKGPITRLKDGLLNLISSPEDTAKMEMYTEYIGVCKYCFDPRTSAWDAPRVHHYHKRRDSFEDLRRRRSNEKLYRKGSNDSLRRVRVDKGDRYYASDSSRRRREDGKSLAAAGVATAANAMFGGNKDFDDTYSVKSGHREESAARRRSRSSSREHRRRSTYGVVRPDKEEFITVRKKDGTTEQRRVRRSSRSTSRERKSSGLYGMAAGAALGAGAAAAASSRRRSRSSSRESRSRRNTRRSTAGSSYSRNDRNEAPTGIFGGFFSPPQKKRRDSGGRKEHRKKNRGFFTFSNSSGSSTNSELAFGDAFSSKASLPLSRKSSTRSTARRGRRKSDDHIAATFAGIGATAAALAAAQRGGRINKRPSMVELGAKKDSHRIGRDGRLVRCSDDDDWEDEMPSNGSSESVDRALAFGELDGRRLSGRQSLESMTPQSSAGGLGAWGWRWGGKDKKRRSRVSTSPPPSYHSGSFAGSTAVGAAAGYAANAVGSSYSSGQSAYDDTGRRLPSTAATYPPSPAQPLQYVDPQPLSEAGSLAGSRHPSMPGAYDVEPPSIYHPGAAPLQQPQPTTPIRTDFTHNSHDADADWSRPKPRRVNSSPSRGTFAQDAALIGAGALATAGIIAATSASAGKKSRGEPSNVRFGLTEEQQRKDDRDRVRDNQRADEERRRADRTRALKEEAERVARESRQEEIRRAREDENRRAAEAELVRQRDIAKREAEHQAEMERQRAEREAMDRYIAEQNQRRDREDAYRREQARLAEEARLQEEKREAIERGRFERLQEVERMEAERGRMNSERERQDSISKRDGKEPQHNHRKQSSSSPWGAVAAAAAVATVGAAVASKDRESSRSRNRSGDSYDPYVKEITPQNSHDGEPLMDDDIYDPEFFKKHTPAENARHEELARKAAEKVVSERELAYADHSTYAEFFAPKDVFSEPAEGKTKVMGPNADNDIPVFRAIDTDVMSRFNRSVSGEVPNTSRHAPYGVPKLTVISPTPPRDTTSPSRTKGSEASSPLSKAYSVDDDVEEIGPDEKAERSRSISWGEDQTHVYDVRTPESYLEKDRDSFFPSPVGVTAGAATAAVAGAALHEIVVEDASTSKPKTTKYSEQDFAEDSQTSHEQSRWVSPGQSNTRPGPSSFYQQPFFDTVSDIGIVLDSSGTEGAPPVRGFIEGETNEPTPVEEKTPRIPGGFNDDNDDIYRPRRTPESASQTFVDKQQVDEPTAAGASREAPPADELSWEPPLSKKEQKKRDEAKRASLVDSEPEKAVKEFEPGPDAEPAWEPPLSKKEQKKRDKAAKRSSTIDSQPSTPPEVEQEAISEPLKLTESPAAEEEPEEFFMSKKDKKKRDKAKKQGFADIVTSVDSNSREMPELETTQEYVREQSPSTRNDPPLSKKEQKKLEKQAKKSGFGGFADVADTILATGGVAAAAAALAGEDDFTSSSSGKKKDKKSKRPKLGEPLDRDLHDVEPESPSPQEQSGMPGGWDSEKEPHRKNSETEVPESFDPFQYQVHDGDDASIALPESAKAQETDPWAEFSEPKKSKKKSKRNSAAFNLPEVSSPLRTEVAWDDYVTGSNPAETSRDATVTESRANGTTNGKGRQAERSPPSNAEAKSFSAERRQSDYFGDTQDANGESSRRRSPDDYRSVVSAPTPGTDDRRKSRRDETRQGSDYFDEPSYAYDTKSIAASEPADLYESSKKSKRRSRHEDDEPRKSRRDDDDDTRSVVSTRSRRDKGESPSSAKKEKKSGILGSLFGRKSEGAPLSRETTRESKASKEDDDEEDRPRRKKKHRDSQAGLDDDDDTRSVKSDSRHRRHRSSKSEHGDDDDGKERRRRSTPEDDKELDASESGRRHHRRRRTDEGENESLSRHTSHSSPDSEKRPHHHRRKTDEEGSTSKDQSFLGMRVEDMPPLPVEIPVATRSSAEDGKTAQEIGTPALAELDTGMVSDVVRSVEAGHEDPAPSAVLSPQTPHSGTRPTSRQGSSTAVPLRFPFGHAPLSPLTGSGRDRSQSFNVAASPGVPSPSSPTYHRKSRQDRPRSTEIKPLYLVERNRKTPEVEDVLPSLPSSKPSSRASSAHFSDDYESAVEDMSASPAQDRKLLIDTSAAETWNAENNDVLGSGEVTPKASEAPRSFVPNTAERQHVKQQPQFYTWEDFAREQQMHEAEEDQPPIPQIRALSPVKAERSRSSSLKATAAAAMLGAVGGYAAHKLADKSPERTDAQDAEATELSRETQIGPLPAPVDQPENESNPLSRKSSIKKKGKKSEKHQQFDASPSRDTENIDLTELQTDPAMYAPRDMDNSGASTAPTKDLLNENISNIVYASAAAHTLPVYEFSGGLNTLSEDPDSTDNQSMLPQSSTGSSHEADRPGTSYRVPTTKSEPAPLIIEERSVVTAGHDVLSESAEISPAPQLTRKQSKKAKKNQKSIPLWEEDDHANLAAALEESDKSLGLDGAVNQEQTPTAEHDLNTTPSETVPTPSDTSYVNFGISDFSNIAQSSKLAWQDSQASAFQSAMSASASDQQTELATDDVQTSRGVPTDETPGSIADAPQEEQDVDLAPVSLKKKSKKDKKKRASIWSEPEAEQNTVPSVTETEDLQRTTTPVIDQEPSREITSDSPLGTPAPEDSFTLSSSKKKSKKDKKKESFAWDEPELERTPAKEVVDSVGNITAENEDPSATADVDMKAGESKSLPDHSAAAADPADEFFAPVSKKKSKKDKKRDSSLLEPPIVPASGQVEQERQLSPECVGESSRGDKPGSSPMTDAASGATLALAAAPLAADAPDEMQDTVPEIADDDFASVSKKKGKNGKRKSQLDWSDFDSTPIVQDEPAAVVETALESDTNKNPGLAVDERDSGRHNDVYVLSPDDSAEPENISTKDAVAEPTGEAGFTSALSRKQSKKDKKKKNRQSQAWEPEPEPEIATTEATFPVEESIESRDESRLVSEPTTIDEDVKGPEEGPNPTTTEMTKSVGEEEVEPVLSRKQSKKDKKKKKQSISSGPEPEPEPELELEPELNQKSINESPPMSSIQVAEDAGKTRHGDEDAQKVPLPEDEDNELTEIADLTPPTAADRDTGLESTNDRGIAKFEPANEPDLGVGEAVDVEGLPENQTQSSGPELPDVDSLPFDAQIDDGTDDFFGPADPVMEEPSRMTEDLDAFGDMDEATVERENRRAAREAAEAAALAEANRPRPQDDNYAALMAARRPSGSKKSKKSRKSISSVNWDESTSGDQTPKSEEQSASGTVASAAIPEEGPSPGNAQDAGDDVMWKPSSKKKGKKGRKSTSGSLTPAVPEEPDVLVIDAMTIMPTAESTKSFDAPVIEPQLEVTRASTEAAEATEAAREVSQDAPPTEELDAEIEPTTQTTIEAIETEPAQSTLTEDGAAITDGPAINAPFTFKETKKAKRKGKKGHSSNADEGFENVGAPPEAIVDEPSRSLDTAAALLTAGAAVPTVSEAAQPENDEWASSSTKKSKKDKKKLRMSGTATPLASYQDQDLSDMQPDKAVEVSPTNEDQATREEFADNAPHAVAEAPEVKGWASSTTKRSKRDKKKAKKDLSAGAEDETVPAEAEPTQVTEEIVDEPQSGPADNTPERTFPAGAEPTQVTKEIMSEPQSAPVDNTEERTLLAEAEPTQVTEDIMREPRSVAADNNVAGEPATAMEKSPVDAWGGIAVKKSKKDKKKAKKGVLAMGEEETVPVETEATNVIEETVKQTEPTPTQASMEAEPPAGLGQLDDDDWGGFAVKESKKDKKKAKRDSSVVEPEAAVSSAPERPSSAQELTQEAPAEATENLAETSRAEVMVEPADEDWGGFALKKSKKDKKKAKRDSSIVEREVAIPIAPEPMSSSEKISQEMPVEAAESFTKSPQDEVEDRPADDDWSGTALKKSKKDKKKAKQGFISTAVADDVAASAEQESEPVIASLEPSTEGPAVPSAWEEPSIAAADPADGDWGGFSTKKSKKDKKKAKQSGLSTPAQLEEVQDVNPKQNDEPSTQKLAVDPPSISVETVSVPIATENAASVVVERASVAEEVQEFGQEQHNEPSIKESEVDPFTTSAQTASVPIERDEASVVDERASVAEEEPTPRSPPNSSQDIDFAATLAAGLAGSGFNPDMVIDDPVFHRRASPTGVLPEADPEETFFTTTSKRKKNKKGKQSLVTTVTPPEEQIAVPGPSLDAALTPSEQLESAIPGPATEPPMATDDFNDTISQGLSGTGFDPALLEKALASDPEASMKEPQIDPEEFSFTTTKRKKDKKGKKARPDGEAAAEPSGVPTPAVNDDNVKSAAAERSLDESTPDAYDQANQQIERQVTTSSDYIDPASNIFVGGTEMDVDDMDKAYKAYKKNKRLQKKLKAAGNVVGSSPDDTERSAAVSDRETGPQTTTLEKPESRSNSRSGPQGYLHTSEVSQSLPVAVGNDISQSDELKQASHSEVPGFEIAAMGVGTAIVATSGRAASPPQSESTRDLSSDASAWSFDPLQDNSSGKGHHVIRDSGYAHSQEQTPRSSREVPAVVRTSSSQESLRNRRSLEPLRISTGSTPDQDQNFMTPQKQGGTGTAEPSNAHARNLSASTGTPLMPSTKDRTSYLFQSPPDVVLGPSDVSSVQTGTPIRDQNNDYFASTPRGHNNRASRDGSRDMTMSPSNNPLSPRTPLRPIQEEHHAMKRSKADTDVGGPERTKAIDRTQTPQGIRARELELLPDQSAMVTMDTARGASNPLSTDDLIRRLSWPAVDEDNDTVNIDRSLQRKAIVPDVRSASVLSNRSNNSALQFRTPEQLRSFSRGSNHSNQSSTGPSLRRINLSGDLRAASRRSDSGSAVDANRPANMVPPFEAPPTPPLNEDDGLNAGSASRAADNMSDVFQGYGDAAQSQVSPTRPPSVRKRQSMHINDLESRLEYLVAENRALQEARSVNDVTMGEGGGLQDELNARDLQLQEKDAEINQIKAMLQPLQEEIARLTEMNNGLTEANRNLVDDTNGRYATLQAEHAEAHEQWQSTSRDLQAMQQEHGRITSGMKDILEAEIASALADKNSEILRLREQLDIATEQIRALQVQIQSSNSSDFLVQRDEDYFDGSCQKLCQHVQQWVLRFSKLSDNRVCRLSTDLNDDKIEARLDNAVLDGSDVDKLLGDRIRRRDVFMSVVMTMVWEYIFTRYLFGMDREQRQKLKTLEKLLSDVGPPRAVAHWRATTLTLLSKRPNFAEQCRMDTEAVAHEIFGMLCALLPPPSTSEQQLLTSLQRVIGIAVDLAIEMRTQRAEYIMLPPLQPEYDTNGDLVRKVHFNASLMNERSGFFSSNEDLAAENAVVKIVLFPLVVKKGDDIGEGDEEIVVCPAQVLVQNDGGKGRKVVRVQSGAIQMDVDEGRRSGMSRRSMLSEGMGSEALA
ncbi:hypothetical protein TI39_contig5829g00007 [Zymoseptoria brevis]|uniref:Involucrin repeat protein n=1 Tax=Zymoseptoria brevis TaxID=1047168 RepID=A0A0F4G6R4_9PEZI|nr:hypothetical protein TI39_contig5829g00007 [Zymoseptoria brevis]